MIVMFVCSFICLFLILETMIQGVRHYPREKVIGPAKPLWFLKKSFVCEPNMWYKVIWMMMMAIFIINGGCLLHAGFWFCHLTFEHSIPQLKIFFAFICCSCVKFLCGQQTSTYPSRILSLTLFLSQPQWFATKCRPLLCFDSSSGDDGIPGDGCWFGADSKWYQYPFACEAYAVCASKWPHFIFHGIEFYQFWWSSSAW